MPEAEHVILEIKKKKINSDDDIIVACNFFSFFFFLLIVILFRLVLACERYLSPQRGSVGIMIYLNSW